MDIYGNPLEEAINQNLIGVSAGLTEFAGTVEADCFKADLYKAKTGPAQIDMATNDTIDIEATNVLVNGLPIVTGSIGTLQETYNESAAVEGSALITTSDTGTEFTVKRGTTGGDSDLVLAVANAAGDKNFNVKGTGEIENTGGLLSKLGTGEFFSATDSLGTTYYFRIDEATKTITIDNDAGAFQEFTGNVISTESLVLHKLPSSGTFKVTNFSNTFDYLTVDDGIGLITLQLSTNMSNTRPRTDDTYDLGSTSLRWDNLYMTGTISNNALSSITFNGPLMTILTNGLTLDCPVTCLGNFTFAGGATPQVDGASDLGQPAVRWGKLYLNDRIDNNGGSSIDFSGGATMTITATSLLLSGVTNSLGNHIFAGTAQPSADNNSDLGTGAVRWKDLYLSNNIDNNDGAVIDLSTTDTIDLQATNVQINGSQIDDLVKKVNGSNYVLDGAGASITTATANYLLGANAGDAITDEINNILIGANSGDALTTNSNVAIGNSTLTNQTVGSLNVTIGTSGFSGITTGSNNVGIGHGVGGTITTTSSNTLIGSVADVETNAISSSIGIGYNVNVDASRHCVIGQETGSTITCIKTGLDSDCDLGETTRKFKNLYLSNTIDNNNGSVIDLSTADTIDLQATNILINGNSITKSYGLQYFINNATSTSIVTQNVYVDIAGVRVVGSIVNEFTSNTSDLEYTGTETKIFKVEYNGEWEAGGALSNAYVLGFHKNGTLITEGQLRGKLDNTNANYPRNVSTSTFVSLATNDTITIKIKNLDGTQNVLVQDMSINIIEID
jgi:hypothetical protein